jgi:hypothetical protein
MSYQQTPGFNTSSSNLLSGSIAADEDLSGVEEGRAAPRAPTTTAQPTNPPTNLGSIPTTGISGNAAEQSIWQQSA